MTELTRLERSIGSVYEHDELIIGYLLIKYLKSQKHEFGILEKTVEKATYYYQIGVSVTYLLHPYFDNKNVNGNTLVGMIKSHIFQYHQDELYPDVTLFAYNTLPAQLSETWPVPNVDLARLADAFLHLDDMNVVASMIYFGGSYGGDVEIEGVELDNWTAKVTIRDFIYSVLDERLGISVSKGYVFDIVTGTLLEDQVKNRYEVGAGLEVEYELVETVPEETAVEVGVRILKRPQMKDNDEHRILVEHGFSNRVVQLKGVKTKVIKTVKNGAKFYLTSGDLRKDDWDVCVYDQSPNIV